MQTISQSISREVKSVSRVVHYIKVAVLAILTWTGVFFCASFLSKMFQGNTIEHAHILPFLISLGIFLVFWFLSVLFSGKERWFVYGNSIISGVLFSLLLYRVFGWYQILIVGVVGIVLLCIGAWSGYRETDTSIKIRFIRVFRTVTTKGIFMVAMSAAFLMYQSSVLHPNDMYTILLPKSFFDSITPLVSNMLKPVLGDVNLSLTLEQIANNSVDAQLKAQSGVTGKLVFTPQMRTSFIEKYITSMQQGLQQSLGISVGSNEKLSDSLYKGLLTKFNGLQDSTKRAIALVFSLMFLLGIGAISWIVRIVLLPIAFVLYEIALLSGFIERSFIQENKERILIP